jgi:hypothetical protein
MDCLEGMMFSLPEAAARARNGRWGCVRVLVSCFAKCETIETRNESCAEREERGVALGTGDPQLE